MACETTKIDIDGLDLEDKLNWVKEILENGRETIGQVQFGEKLALFIGKLTVSLAKCFYTVRLAEPD